MAPPPAGGAVPQLASLYVGDLNQDVTEAHLYEIFNAVGPVGSIRVCRDKIVRKSLGYAYVNFHNASDAERALDTLNYSSIRGRSCRLSWSQRDSSVRDTAVGNIFVKNLDLNIDNKALFDTFSIFGNIVSCKVASSADGKSKGYGFVQFETEESANDAIERVNGVKVGELVVEVHEFKKREREEKSAEQGFKNLYIKSFPKEWDDAKLKETFGVFGELSATAVRTDWKGRPFGFVDFVTVDDAQRCVSEMHLKEMRSPEQIEEDNASGKVLEKDQDGHPLHLLYVGKMQSKAERAAEFAKKGGGAGGKAGKGSGKNGGAPGYRTAKGGWDSKGWDSKGGNKGFGGFPSFPGMPPMVPPGVLGMKGTPMVANPQQMMAVMSMMGKGMPNPMAMMGKGMAAPMGKGPKGGRFPGPPAGSSAPPLTAATLSAFPLPVQKQMIGEKLFRQVSNYQPDQAAKLTGMMLEMTVSELLMLLESEERLKRQIDHALGVLSQK